MARKLNQLVAQRACTAALAHKPSAWASLPIARSFLTLSLSVLAGVQIAQGTTTFQITDLKLQNGNVVLSWQGGGTTNQVQYATSLSGPWQDLGLPTTASSITTPQAGPIAFYRVTIATDSGFSTLSAKSGGGGRSQCTFGISSTSTSFAS